GIVAEYFFACPRRSLECEYSPGPLNRPRHHLKKKTRRNPLVFHSPKPTTGRRLRLNRPPRPLSLRTALLRLAHRSVRGDHAGSRAAGRCRLGAVCLRGPPPPPPQRTALRGGSRHRACSPRDPGLRLHRGPVGKSGLAAARNPGVPAQLLLPRAGGCLLGG